MRSRLHMVDDSTIGEDRLSSAQRERFERYLAEILTALGLDLGDDSRRRTPERLLGAWIESTSGYSRDPKLVTAFAVARDADETGGSAQVVEGPIAFTALCEHHALPFFGRLWMGYVADDALIGLSKLTRIARQYSRRFTMQERMSREIAAELQACIGARGVAVRAEAAHLCTRMRGVREAEALTATSIWRGRYEQSADLRAEFLSLCARDY